MSHGCVRRNVVVEVDMQNKKVPRTHRERGRCVGYLLTPRLEHYATNGSLVNGAIPL